MPHDPFYNSPDWRALRRAVLLERPVCEIDGCIKRASHVDHKMSRRKGGAPLDKSNLKALCHSCHSSKTASVDGAFGNPESRKGCDVDGWPLRPRPEQA